MSLTTKAYINWDGYQAYLCTKPAKDSMEIDTVGILNPGENYWVIYSLNNTGGLASSNKDDLWKWRSEKWKIAYKNLSKKLVNFQDDMFPPTLNMILADRHHPLFLNATAFNLTFSNIEMMTLYSKVY